MYFRVQSQLSKHHRTHQMNTDYHDFMQTMDFSGKHWSGVTTRDFPGNERDSSPWCDPISAARGKRNALWYGDRTWKWVFWGLMLWSLEKTALHLSSGRFQTHYRTQTSKWKSGIFNQRFHFLTCFYQKVSHRCKYPQLYVEVVRSSKNTTGPM